jgi:hypothetical protein
VSYTLRGRIESRLVAVLLPLAGAAAYSVATANWWAVQLVALMWGAGLALDVLAYHRLLPYQAGWVALPLGLAELGIVMGLARAAGISVPLGPALALFAAAWTLAQLLGHVVLPLARLGYATDGGELGRAGPAAAVAALALLAGAGGVAYAHLPPTVHLAAGVHRGPIVIDRREILAGSPGTIVEGGIVVRANGVTVRDLAVVGGENGIDVEGVERVKLVRVAVSGAALDGIHVRDASVTIRDCTVNSTGSRYGQGIDISFAMTRPMSMVDGCRVVGGQEGIVTHFTMAKLVDNRVARTTLRAISMTEMSMGEIERNTVEDALGVGIFCNDHSMCDVRRNVVTGTRVDRASGDATRAGSGFLAAFWATAELHDNRFEANPKPLAAVTNAVVSH